MTTTTNVRLPGIFRDNMVLQRNMPIPIWGKASPGENITVSFAGQTKQVKTDNRGKWTVKLAPLKANSNPSEMTVTGRNIIKFKNVLVGEVWLCAGQSNMSMGIMAIKNARKEVAQANYPNIRLFYVHSANDLKQRGWPHQETDVESLEHSSWKVCSPETLKSEGEIHCGWKNWKGFSAVAYFFGREIHNELNVPVALIQVAVGGTKIDGWINPKQNPMLRTLFPFATRGVIWYQGEANVKDGMEYVKKFSCLIANWRRYWKATWMPFYIVQIAPLDLCAKESNLFTLPEFWDAQYHIVKEIPNTGIVGTSDVGDLENIHPKEKLKIGRRLAYQALQKTYGKKNIVADVPVFKSMSIDGNEVIITFDNVPTGLKTRDDKAADWFEILDASVNDFVRANAVIMGKKVIISNPNVQDPVAVRFGWNNGALHNLISNEGLPVYPFNTLNGL